LKSASRASGRPNEIDERVLDEEVPVRTPQTRMIEVVAIVADRLSRDDRSYRSPLAMVFSAPTARRARL